MELPSSASENQATMEIAREPLVMYVSKLTPGKLNKSAIIQALKIDLYHLSAKLILNKNELGVPNEKIGEKLISKGFPSKIVSKKLCSHYNIRSLAQQMLRESDRSAIGFYFKLSEQGRRAQKGVQGMKFSLLETREQFQEVFQQHRESGIPKTNDGSKELLFLFIK